jgi:3-phenylpropionate/trans-cinnamate dioxygenase ferredoxin reductase subunit
MSPTVLIAGAGHGAGQVVATLKQHKYEGRIVLVGDEPYLPYQRPPLSKKFLSGEMPPERLYFKPASFYDDPQIEVYLDTHIREVDREAGCVRTDEGEQLGFDTLVMATGSRARRLPVAGSDLDGIHYLRNIGDVDGIHADTRTAKRIVIVGAGYIGLEVAAVARQLGLEVTVIEMADRVLSRVVSEQVSTFYQDEHRSRGVELLLSTGLRAFRGNGRVSGVETDDGTVLPADLVVVGVGILPNTELAQACSLEVDDGIIVDDMCRTSDPDIYAIGDCTSQPNGIYGRTLRLESVHNALEQAKTAASNICGIETHYCQVPWFWSDQYDLKLQIAGLSQDYDAVVVRGRPEDRSFACLYLRQGRLIAVDAINAPRDFVQSKPLIENHAVIAPEKLADTSVMLKDLA